MFLRVNSLDDRCLTAPQLQDSIQVVAASNSQLCVKHRQWTTEDWKKVLEMNQNLKSFCMPSAMQEQEYKLENMEWQHTLEM